VYNARGAIKLAHDKGIIVVRLQWEGYPNSENSWEPYCGNEQLDCVKDLVRKVLPSK
jgi:hypothetical protein